MGRKNINKGTKNRMWWTFWQAQNTERRGVFKSPNFRGGPVAAFRTSWGLVSVLVMRAAAQQIPQTIQTLYGTIDKLGCEQSHRHDRHGRT
jgi:hypothetical protein